MERKITFIGRMHEQKGLIYLLKAFEEISKENPEFKLEIIGDINEYANFLIEEYKNKACGKNIIWKGYIKDRNEIARQLMSSYIICLPSLWEGLPLTLLESLASNRPVIVSDIPAFKSVVNDNKEVIMFRVQDASDLKNKISDLINSKESKIKLLTTKALALAKEHSWDKIARETEKLY